jgi:DNA modification methylase
MTPYFQDNSITLYNGDCREVLKSLPDESIDCCVTSPPYFGLRDYGVEGQLGLEPSPREYVAQMVEVFREVRRVLKPEATCWLNLGDSYANDGKWGGHTGGKHAAALHCSPLGRNKRYTGLKPKDLIGVPWRVALALQDDGWWLRQDIIWSKPNPMPESVTDRCTKAHEYVFLLSKSERYYFSAEAIAEPAVTGWNGSEFHTGKTAEHQLGRAGTNRAPRPAGNRTHKYVTAYNESGTEEHRTKAGLLARAGVIDETHNRRSVWTISTRPYTEAHFATMPEELARLCILAGCPAGGTVLDPFAGAGTTLKVAEENGCRAVGIELNPAYCGLIMKRIRQRTMMFHADDENVPHTLTA